MWGRVIVPNIYSDATVCAKIYNIPLRVKRIGIVLFVREKQNGVIVVALEGTAVHDKEFMPCLVDDLVDSQVIRDAWNGRGL